MIGVAGDGAGVVRLFRSRGGAALTNARLKHDAGWAEIQGMETRKQTLWHTFVGLLAAAWRSLHPSSDERGGSFCASAPAQTPNDAGLCYFHLN